jgi:hypothetical protein
MEKYINLFHKKSHVILSIRIITNKYGNHETKKLFYSLLSILLFSNCEQKKEESY